MLSRLFREISKDSGFAFVAGANAIAAASGGIFWLSMASLVSVGSYGQVNYLVSIATISFGLGVLGMDTTIMTFLNRKSILLLYQANSLVLIASIVIAGTVAIVTNNYIIGLLSPSLAFYYMSTVELISKKKYKEYAAITIGGKVIQIFLSVFLFIHFGINGFLLGYIISDFVFGYRFAKSLTHFNFRLDELKSVWRFSAKVFGSNTINTLMQNLDKALIASFFGYQVLGNYQLSFQIFLFISIIPSTLFRYLLPHESAGIIKTRIKALGIIASVLLSLIIIVLAPVAIPIFYPKYIEAIGLIQIVGLCVIPLTLVNLMNTKILSENKKTSQIFFAGALSLISEIILLIILGTYSRLTGLGVALLLATTAQFAYLFIANGKRIF